MQTREKRAPATKRPRTEIGGIINPRSRVDAIQFVARTIPKLLHTIRGIDAIAQTSDHVESKLPVAR
jgi:hypothetical protein